MRENRPSGLEGGARSIPRSYPYRTTAPLQQHRNARVCPCGGRAARQYCAQQNNLENALMQTIEEIRTLITNLATVYGMKILAALAILLVGSWVAKGVRSLVHRLLEKRKLEPVISSFLTSLTYIGFMAFVIVAALGVLEVQTASFVAVVGAAGLAIGLALQGSLANFAAGFLLIIFRPFKKGDYIEGGGTSGIVEEVQVFTTILKTPDHKRVIVPNGKLMGDNITNYSALETRRLDLIFGVSYGDDIKKVKAILQRVAGEDARILKDPAPLVVLSELADSSVNFILRVYVKSGDYWGVKFDTTEKVKMVFDAEDVTIPFPQRDVHLFQPQAG
jgi:small conductance mechanosensitive channel